MAENNGFRQRKQMRLPGYDYSQNGSYFVTICVENKRWLFGRVVQDEVRLSEMGRVALSMWTSLPRRFGYVRLDEFIIMPNHVHGIVVIDHPDAGLDGVAEESRPLWELVAAFKAVTTMTIRKQLKQLHFSWQPNFYDHIIRNEIVLHRIRRYIVENPVRWSDKTGLCWL